MNLKLEKYINSFGYLFIKYISEIKEIFLDDTNFSIRKREKNRRKIIKIQLIVEVITWEKKTV